MTYNQFLNQSSVCCRFKASISSFIVLEILRNDINGIVHNLTETLRHAPHFFTDSPVIIDLDKIKEYGSIDFIQLKSLLQSHSIIPVGISGGSEIQQQEALRAGLPVIKTNKTATHEKIKSDKVVMVSATLISYPIRSGMQIYAKENDLIITAQVSSGAEIMADGHIHVYGPLRGKAIAGIKGNKEARIFCQSLQADLIAIAGYYLTREEMILPKEKQCPIQMYLKNDRLQIEAL